VVRVSLDRLPTLLVANHLFYFAKLHHTLKKKCRVSSRAEVTSYPGQEAEERWSKCHLVGRVTVALMMRNHMTVTECHMLSQLLQT
jgi:hypothetical protein